MKNVARRIKEVRESKGISREELADSLHLSVEQLDNFESGETKLSNQDIIEFATALETSEEYLRRGAPGALSNVDSSSIEHSSVTTANQMTTNNYYQGQIGHSDDPKISRVQLKAQLDRIEIKLDKLNEQLDFLIKAGVIRA